MLGRLVGLGFRLDDIDEGWLWVQRADLRKLVERFPPTSEAFTNLLCIKAPIGTTG